MPICTYELILKCTGAFVKTAPRLIHIQAIAIVHVKKVMDSHV